MCNISIVDHWDRATWSVEVSHEEKNYFIALKVRTNWDYL